MSKKMSRDDINRFHDSSLYIPTRTIYVGSEEHSMDSGESGTDGAMAARLIKNLHILESISKDPIVIIMNNLGGDEYHGLGMFDAVKTCQSHVSIQVFAHAMSMGSIILQAADERIMSVNSVQMIHYGTWGNYDHSKIMQVNAKEGLRLDNWMEQMYLTRIREKHPKFSLARLKQMLNFDTYLTAQQSVELGLADKVL